MYRPRSKKRRARAIRGNGSEYVEWKEGEHKGSRSSHLMYNDGKKAWTSIFPEKKGSHDPKDWKDIPDKKESLKEAEKRGEVFEFRTKRRAKKFAHGSWKKGKDRKVAMKAFRESNKEDRRNSKYRQSKNNK